MGGAVTNDGATNIGAADSMDGTLIRLKAQQKKEEAAKSERSKASIAQIEAAEGGYSKPAPEFKPTAETASGLMGLMSLVAAAGGILGGKGRTSGLMAINAASGMMEGYNKGRSELYEQQRQMFDEHMKSWEQNRKLVKEAFDRALRIAPTNLTLAQETLNRDLIAMDLKPLAAINKTSGPMAAHAAFSQFDSKLEEQLKPYRQKLGSKATLSDVITEYEATKADERAKAAADTAALEKRKKVADVTEAEAKASRGGQTLPEYEKTQALGQISQDLAIQYYKDRKPPVITDKDTLIAFKNLYPNIPVEKSTGISDDAANLVADLYMQRGPEAFKYFSRGKASTADLDTVWSKISQKMSEQGKTADDLREAQLKYVTDTSAARALGSVQGRTATAYQTVGGAMQVAKDMSDKVPRSTFRSINSLIQKGETEISDPDLLDFKMAVTTLALDYARATNPTGTSTVDLRKKAFELFNEVDSKEAFDKKLETATAEISRAMAAPGKAADFLFGSKKVLPSVLQTTSKTAAERYDELANKGMTEEEIYKQIAKEGW